MHGSSLFTRGETQAIVAVTLGTARDGQIIDAVGGEYKDHFLFHYNFPPYSVGEAGRMMGPKRREIGHGRLAKRGVLAVMPTMEAFPYTIRVVSEITESNGSSSMASVCGSSLALMDAGVPIKAPVAGIAMGLVKEGDDFVVLSDILGDEDHLGDMDFKVAGTSNGISALQMDIKIQGITEEIMKVALAQAKAGRLHILGEMAHALTAPRAELSDFAPRLITIKIHPDKIREVIGKGGSVIQAITKETGTQIDIQDDGTITIASVDAAAGKAAKDRIEQITSDVEPGRIYEGKVAKIMDFGAFVTISPGQGRPGPRVADLQRSRREGLRRAQGRRPGQGQGAGSRQAGPHPPVDEGRRGRRGRRGRVSARDPLHQEKAGFGPLFRCWHAGGEPSMWAAVRCGQFAGVAPGRSPRQCRRAALRGEMLVSADARVRGWGVRNARRMAASSLLVAAIGLATSGQLTAGQLDVKLVDRSGKSVSDAVVTLWPAAGQVAAPAEAHVRRIVDQRKLVFVPYLQVMRPGDEVVFRNSDSTNHHVYSFSSVRAFEFVLAPGQSSPPQRLDKAGAIAIGCNIHDQMISYIYVTDAPRYVQSDASGRAAFGDVPDGDYEVRVWQPRLRPGKPEPRQVVTLGSAPKALTVTLNLLPDPRQRVDREHVHY